MKKILFITSIVSLFFISCTNEDNQSENCLDFKHASITNVDTEILTVEKNKDLPIQLTYTIENSCGNFYDFDVVRQDKIYDIKINAKYEGCTCNEIASNKQITYYFRAIESGIYTLNFSVSNNEFISKTIYVQ